MIYQIKEISSFDGSVLNVTEGTLQELIAHYQQLIATANSFLLWGNENKKTIDTNPSTIKKLVSAINKAARTISPDGYYNTFELA